MTTEHRLVIGADQAKETRSRAITPGQLVERSGDASWGWVGEVHAVPAGTTTALCGHEVRWVFDDSPWPGIASSWCRECSGLTD